MPHDEDIFGPPAPHDLPPGWEQDIRNLANQFDPPLSFEEAELMYISSLEEINFISRQTGITPEDFATEQSLRRAGLTTPSRSDERLFGDGGPGSSGSALGWAQLAETQKNNAFNRVRDQITLLQTTDQLQQARQENAMNALVNALPYMVAPGTEFSPGFEPGGPAMQLSNLVGANLQPPPLQTAEVPVQDYLDQPQSVTPDMIREQLGAFT